MSGPSLRAPRGEAVGAPAALRVVPPWVPVAVYAFLTLVLPAVRGGWRRPEFWTHAGWILAVASALLVTIALARCAWRLAVRAVRRVVFPRRDRGISQPQAGELS
ncbi:MAG: hypothetical protein R3B48_29085 [Kofleriaceae bacterium]